MRGTIPIMLCGLDRKGEACDVYSRGSVHTIYGYECVYVGPAPDGTAYFWLAPGDIRGLNAEQLAEHGLELRNGQEGLRRA